MIRHLFYSLLILCIPQILFADIYSASEALSRGDYDTAAREFKQLAEAGDARAQANLGYLYYVGEGVPQSYQDAVEWYRKAATQGDKDAQYNLAVAYAFGEGAEQDYQEAALWYRRAADQGHILSQYSLGISYSFGEGVKQNSAAAVNWFRQAADQGYERAQVQLASKYHTGDGVDQDYGQAVVWYRKAADRGNAAAQYNLGTLYRAGKGVQQDYNQARRWFHQAADQGYAAAQIELDSIERAIAGAARSNTRPNLQPSPIVRPEPSVVPKETLAPAVADVSTITETTTQPQIVETAPVVAVAIEATETQPRRGFFGRLFGRGEDTTDAVTATEAESAVDSESTTGQISASTGSESELLSLDDSSTVVNAVAEPLAETELLAAESGPVSDETETAEVPVVDDSRPRGFFSRLFNRNSRKTTTVEITEEQSKEPGTTDSVEQEQQSINEETIALVEAEEEEVQPRRGFFGRLFGKKSADQSEANIVVSTEKEIETSDAPITNDESTIEIYTVDLSSPQNEEIPISESESILTGTDDDRGPILQEEEGLQAITDANDEEIKGGFFRNLFRRSKSVPEVDKIDDSSVVIAKEPADVMDIDNEPTSYNEAITGSTVSNDTDTKTVDVKPKGGFFRNLFKRSGSDKDRSTDDTGITGIGSGPEDKESTVFQSDPVEYQAALDSLNNKRYDEAYILFRALAVQGDPAAQYQLGSLYIQGLGISQDYQDAMYWYQQSAEHGHVDAQYSLGNMYLMGEGIEQSDKQANYWYEKAAAQGHDSAQHNLVNLRKVVATAPDDIGKIVPGEIAEDAEGYRKPEQEKKSRFSFIKNIFSKKDKTKEEDSEKSGATGNISSSGPVTEPEEKKKSFFGRLFGKGDKEKESEQIAMKEKQAISPEMAKQVSGFIEFENTRIQAMIAEDPAKNDYDKGLEYQYGEGVDKDSEASFNLFMKSAQQGYAPAQYKIGTAYAYGEGVTKDNSEAARWYNLAARQGHAIAQRNLGVMYLNGDGVEQNRPLAHAWYSVLADNGNVMDIRRRDMLDNELSPPQKQEAIRLKKGLLTEILVKK